MISICFLCGKQHKHTDCELWPRPPKAPEPPSVLVQEVPRALPLAPTQFEQLFGRGAEGLLQDVAFDNEDRFSPDEKTLALSILTGKPLASLDNDERQILDGITFQLAGVPKPKIKVEPKVERQGNTWQEMEDFGDLDFDPTAEHE